MGQVNLKPHTPVNEKTTSIDSDVIQVVLRGHRNFFSLSASTC